MRSQQEYVLRTVEERAIRFVAALVHRRPRHGQDLQHHSAELENASKRA